LPDAPYGRAGEILGEALLIGFYTILAIVLVGFDVDIPGEVETLPL
jgi:hypothetical protein